MNWRNTFHVGATLMVVAAAAVVWHDLPVNSQIYAPFDVVADAGVAATGRNITATVLGTQITPVVRPENGRPDRLEAAGVWVVINATVAAVEEPGLLRTQLEVGPDTYTPTDRLSPSSTAGGLMQPALQYRADWVFDVDPESLADADIVRLRLWLGDGRLDSRLVIDIRLDGPKVSRLEAVRLPRPEVSAP